MKRSLRILWPWLFVLALDAVFAGLCGAQRYALAAVVAVVAMALAARLALRVEVRPFPVLTWIAWLRKPPRSGVVQSKPRHWQRVE